ncbi:MAG: hypothetical protein WDN25_00765 [Acetobacteraceae bacterium]
MMASPRPVAAVSAGGGTVGLAEGLEQLRKLRLAHADAGVADREVDPAAGTPRDGEFDRALLGELAGIAQQV